MNTIGFVEIAGALVFFGCLGWLFAFFQWVRPRLMARVGRWLRVEVEEAAGGFESGLYEATGSVSAGRSVAVFLADAAVTVFGTVGVFALVSVPAFLIADAGVVHRWEGVLTGAAARIEGVDVADMATHRAVATATVRNRGSKAAPACMVSVADYTGRNGYLTGRSDFFDLAPGVSTTIPMTLSATRHVPGVHSFRVSLECANRLKDKTHATIRVGTM